MGLSVTDSSGEGQQYVLSCDDCRERQLSFSTELDSKAHPKAMGWSRSPRDLCPRCFADAMRAVLAEPVPERASAGRSDAA